MQIGKTDISGIGAAMRPLSATSANASQTTQTTPDSTGGSTGSGSNPPVTGGLRTQSPTILTEAQDDRLANLNTASFADMVTEKTQAFAKTLMDVFKTAKIPTDEPIVLNLDSSGRVTTNSPYKERIEKLFKDDPDLAKQLKDIAGLNALVALNDAMRRYSEAKRKAGTDKERKLAEANYMADCMTIQSRSNTMVLADGALTSAATSYMAGRS